ncbi:MAG: NADH-quinone oxidoreductase subunit J [Nitrospinae bacterium]|nr:NADH-quinone oxidoreductase subunit J [Nitrospinota bacterium]
MELLIFYPIAALCIVLALAVVLNKNPINSAMSLIGMMLGLAAIFASMQAHFIAILQIIIYAGAIMVLFMFVIMLLNLKEDAGSWMARDKNKLLNGLTAVMLVGGLYKIIDVLTQTDFKAAPAVEDSFGTVARIGEALFTDFVLPFEVASILLLAAMVGVVVLAKSKLD